MKKLIIAFALLMMLSGGTISVLKTLKISPFAEVEGEEAAVEEIKKEDPPAYISVPVMVIPIFEASRVKTNVEVTVKLETTKSHEDEVNKKLPRLANTYRMELHGLMPRLMAKDENLDVRLLKHHLELMTNEVLGEGLVKGVLVQSVKEH